MVLFLLLLRGVSQRT